MRTRLLLLVLVSLLFSAARTFAQTPAGASPSATMTPTAGDVFTVHQFSVSGLTPGSTALIVLFDPVGGETILHAGVDDAGTAHLALSPDPGSWRLGLYRAVVALPSARSVSAVFSVGDGGKHLMVGPDLPSPNSVLEVSGTGLPPKATIHLVLTIAGGLGQRDVSASTDADGALTLRLWPQALGFDFFSAGRYELSVPDLGLDAAFYVREHPSTSFITLGRPVQPDVDVPLQLQAYPVNRYIWAAYANAAGQTVGEFLVGPTDARGVANATVRFPPLPPGTYLFATPYDWGETTFTLDAPPPTATATPTVTPTATPTASATPTQTPAPTPTRVVRRPPTPRPTVVHHRTCTYTKKHRRRCRR